VVIRSDAAIRQSVDRLSHQGQLSTATRAVLGRFDHFRFEMPQELPAESNCAVAPLSHGRLFVSAMGKAVGNDIADGKKKVNARRH